MIYKLVCAANNSFTKLYKKDDDEIKHSHPIQIVASPTLF